MSRRLAGGLALWFLFGCATSAQAQLQAGAARAEFVLPEGVPLAGYSRRGGDPSQGLHDPVGVRALVLQEGASTAVLISSDLLIIDEWLSRAVRERLAAEGFPSETVLVLAATHTHSGPGAYGRRFLEKISMGHYDSDVFEGLVGSIVDAAARAKAQAAPAEVACGSVPTEGLVKNRAEAHGPVDAELSVCAVRRPGQDAPIAALINFAAHPTTLGAWNMALSADYPGVIAAEVERRWPGAACLFFAGAVGDQGPVKSGDGFWRAEFLGKPLAQQAVALLERGLPAASRGASLAARQETFPLPSARVRLGRRIRLPGWIGRRLVDDDATVSVVRAGPLALFGVPCDLAVSLGQELKAAARARGLQPIVAGFADDYIGYCVPQALYHDAQHYESLMAFNGPLAGEQVVERLVRLLEGPTGPTGPGAGQGARVEQHDGLRVVYLSGTPYEIGRQHGELLREDVRACVRRVLGYFRGYLRLPLMRTWAANWWLDRPWRAARPFIPPRYLEELKGLADGSGVPLKELYRLHAVPDRTYSCSNFAAWGRATRDGRLIHARNLDWNIEAGLQQFATVFVVRPQGQRPFVNVAWAGFIGVLSGINDAHVSIGQIGAETTDAAFDGEPMVFVMRRVMEEAQTLEEAAAVVREARRTVGVNYVIADADRPGALALETTRRRFHAFAADDPAEHAVHYARPMTDAVLRADTAVDPEIRERQLASDGDPKRPGLEPPGGSAYSVRYLGQAEGLLEAHGGIDAAAAQAIVKAVAPDSNVQSVIFAWPDLWVANAEGTTRAAQTTYRRLNLERLFAEK